MVPERPFFRPGLGKHGTYRALQALERDQVIALSMCVSATLILTAGSCGAVGPRLLRFYVSSWRFQISLARSNRYTLQAQVAQEWKYGWTMCRRRYTNSIGRCWPQRNIGPIQAWRPWWKAFPASGSNRSDIDRWFLAVVRSGPPHRRTLRSPEVHICMSKNSATALEWGSTRFTRVT